MTNTPDLLAGSGDLLQVVRDALVQLRTKITWKPGKDIEHVRTRIQYGHLPAGATLADYEKIIMTIIQDGKSRVFVFRWRQDLYPTAVSVFQGQTWLVMFSLGGVMETAFPPEDAKQYLSDRRFEYLGTTEELIRE